jgi:hypothetical protein
MDPRFVVPERPEMSVYFSMSICILADGSWRVHVLDWVFTIQMPNCEYTESSHCKKGIIKTTCAIRLFDCFFTESVQ